MVLLLLMQIYAMPVFDMLETVLVKKLHFKPSITLRFITRNVYVGKYGACFPLSKEITASIRIKINVLFCLLAAFTMFVGITFPFFGGLLGFFGGFAFAPTTYFVST